MTPENSVRVPGWKKTFVADAAYYANQLRPMATTADTVVAGVVTLLDDIAALPDPYAAPAPAGCNCASGRGAEHCAVHAPADEFGPVTEAELDAARAPNPLIVTPQPEQGAGLDTFADKLAQEIRRVDGNHSLGAGALADALTPFILARQQSRAVDGWRVERVKGSMNIIVSGNGQKIEVEHGEMLWGYFNAALEGDRDGR